MTTATKSLKAANLAWQWSVVAVDTLVIVLLAFPELLTNGAVKEFAWVRALFAGAAPVIVLLIASLFSSDIKATLVFWRIKETLPGHRAFSVHALCDPRIDLEALRKHVGAFPQAAREQNALWFKLYKKVESEITVAEAHRHYLLFRDLASMSILLIPIAAVALHFTGASGIAALSAAVFLFVQYAATAIAARHSGIGFVTNVLTLHSVKRYV